MAHEYLAEGANNRPSSDEDDSETHHEKDCAHHSTCPTLSFNDVCGPQACHIAEIARDERQDARGKEGQQTGKYRHRDRSGHRSSQCPGCPRSQVEWRHWLSLATSLIAWTRVAVLTSPTNRAAERPLRSMTRVDGIALGGNSVNLSSNAPSGS